MKKLIFTLMSILIFQLGYAQNNVFVIGNLDNISIEERLTPFREMLKKEKEKFVLLITGNINQEVPENEEIFLNFLKEVEGSGSKVFVVTGDHDWDNSGIKGLENIKALEKTFKAEIHKNVIVPKNNCPGPYIKDVGDNIRIIAINSQWWLHPYRKQLPTDSKCDNILPLTIIDAVNEAIKEADDRKVFLVAHHPVVSGGVFGGNSNSKEHFFPFSHDDPTNRTFLPFYGSLYHYFRQNVGYEQDMNNPAYKKYIANMNEILLNNQNIVFCTSHEYSLQLHEINSNHQIISGSLSKSAVVHRTDHIEYKNKKPGFAKVEVVSNNEASCSFYLLDPSSKEFVLDEKMDLHEADVDHEVQIETRIRPKVNEDGSVKAGNYKAGFVKRLFLGRLHRDFWEQHVQIPELDIQNTHGGLTPIEVGGSKQTVSVKLKSKEGKTYAFRSMNKTPAKGLARDFRFTAAEKFKEDLTSSQNPYSGIYVAELLNYTGILHVTPSPYLLPDSPVLGEYQKKFGGMLGTLEEKPKSPKNGVPGFANADKVVSSLYLFEKIYQSPNTTVDKKELAKTMVFDMFIGDWDRHEDNIKWAGFKDGKKMNYRPIPRDRDHSFSQLSGGIIPYLLDREWALPFRENFDYKFKGVRSLTWKTRFYDRLLLAELDREDWLQIVDKFNSEITEEVIDKSIDKLPKEVQELFKTEITPKLKSRKKGLKEAVETYYGYLAKEVDIVGSNKADFFKVTRLEDGKVKVQMGSKNTPTEFRYSRVFDSKETKEIRLYGLAKRDSFLIDGHTRKSILIRVMGGKGEDYVEDLSSAKGAKKTIVYDYLHISKGTNVKKGKETKTIFTDDADLNEYDRTRFKYNTYLPTPIIVANSDDGIGGGLTLNFKNFGFGHRDYKSKYRISASATSNNSLVIAGYAQRNIARTNWFYHGNAEYGNFFPFYNFYGVGNNSPEIDSDLASQGFYEERTRGAIFKAGLSHKFLTKSSIKFELISEILDQESKDIDEASILRGVDNLQAKNTGGGEVALSIDFRDSPSFTTKGIKLDLSQTSYVTSSGPFGKTKAALSYYGTVKIGLPITLGVTAGTERIYGDAIPYYHLANAGQSEHLRGFRANRFAGEGINHLNADLRFHFGKSETNFLPFYYGLIAFADVAQVVDNDELFEDKWHNGYGVGFYLTPISKNFPSLNISFARSEEESLLFKFGFGALF